MTRALQKPTTVKNIVLTDRDKTIIRACHQYTLVANHQLKQITKAVCSDEAFNRRVRDLWGADFLARPERQREVFSYRDRRPTLNALGQAGANWLEKQGVKLPEGKGWTHAATQFKSSTFMEHQLGTADSYLAFRDGFNAIPDCRLIEKPELLAASSPATQRMKEPWRLPTQFQHIDGQVKRRSTKPDDVFAIGDRRGGDQERRSLLFLEFDNGTEDFVRSDPDQSMILGLYLRYADMYKRQLHTDRYGFNLFRVPIVVGDGWNRVHKMLHIFQSHVAHLVPPGLFVHTSFETLLAEGVNEEIWLNGKGKRVQLLND